MYTTVCLYNVSFCLLGVWRFSKCLEACHLLTSFTLPHSRSRRLIWTLVRNPATPSDKPSNRQSINTGVKSNPTTLTLKLVECGRGLQTIKDHKGNPSRELPRDVSVADELEVFYARFEANNCVINLSVADVSKTFKQVNSHKAAGPFGVPGRIPSMRWPAGKCLHWHFQPLPDPVCNTYMFHLTQSVRGSWSTSPGPRR